MLYSEIIALFSDPHKTHKYAVCVQNVEFLDIITGGTYSNHRALKGYSPGVCNLLLIQKKKKWSLY
jgi:hypothetical protein